MNRRNPARFVLIALLLTAAVTHLAGVRPQSAAQPASQTDLMTQPIPVEGAITVGQLPNGVKYYIRTNNKPEKRAEFRLVVKAGSILEEDDQQGMAHFVEHMAFNGTKNFPKDQIIQAIESMGMRFGADLNAYTSFDETVYMLQVPTDKTGNTDKAIQILEDWAHNVSFDDAEIDKERGVVMEEWRLRRGAGMRVLDKLFPVLLNGSRYADRIPIGKPDVIQNGAHARLKKFYSDWYRPDLQAVVAVGDFDKSAVENLIKTRFGSIPAQTSARPRTKYSVPDHPGTVFTTVTDKETTSTSVEVENLMPARPEGFVGTYRAQMVDGLFISMLNSRFAEMSVKADAPFVAAGVDRGSFVTADKDEVDLSVRVREGSSQSIEQALDAVMTEAERVRRFGFTASELERQKTNILRSYERMVAEKQSRESGSHADEYVRNFLTNESLPGADLEYAMHQRFLPQISLAEVNALANDWFKTDNRFVVVNAPDKAGLRIPTETELAATIRAAAGKDLKAYVDAVASASLMDTLPTPGKVVKTTTRADIGITEWDLSNGAHVILKPTNFKDDEILFRATSPGGTSLAPDKDYVADSVAAQIIAAGGVGQFNTTELRKVLTGKVASASASIGELEEGLSGSSSPKDMETMFQLLNLRFTKPRADETVFGLMVSQMKTVLANQRVTPEFAFADTLNSTMTQNHMRRQIPGPESVDQWNLDKSLAFYKDRFADASDFTFVFVGNFEIDKIRPLIERYVASLPALNRKETWKDVGVRTPTGTIDKTVKKGSEPKGQTAIIFSGPFEYNQARRVEIRAMAQILQTRLLETIREELGGTYSISVQQSYQKIPNQEYNVEISFGSDPQRTDALIKRVSDEIEKFKNEGPSAKQVTDEKEALLREFDTNSKQNGYLLSQILFKYQYNEDVAGLWQAPAIQAAAKLYLNPKNMVTVKLFPEK